MQVYQDFSKRKKFQTDSSTSPHLYYNNRLHDDRYGDETVMHAVFLFLFFVNTSRIFLILNSCLSHAF